jgi:hypothetical protein
VLESKIVEALLKNIKKLQSLGVNIRAIKIHGGIWTSGEPDIVGCWVGRFFAWEMKTATGRATKRQESSLRKWASAGGITGIYRDPVTPLTDLNPEWAEILSESAARKRSSKQDTIEGLNRDGGFD